jgi:hypothetical protein
MDADGKPFFQNATASNLSSEGALLGRLGHPLKMGEIIGIQSGEAKARFEIKWVKAVGVSKVFEAGVRIMQGQIAPWQELTAETRAAGRLSPRGMDAARPGDKRRFVRHRVNFPITISFPEGHRSHMQCTATDIGGRGCYVESLVPLQIGTNIIITFWIDSEKFSTKAIVRASDPGVGMGLEFTALEVPIQQKLQAYLDKIDQGFASAASSGG